jgi:hypothetical protein
MSSILMVETASPKRVRKKAEELLRGSDPPPAITILSTGSAPSIEYLGRIEGVRVVPLVKGKTKEVIRQLRATNFDFLYTFWTAERKYHHMKLLACRMKAGSTWVDLGDGGVFRLTWKFVIRVFFFRLLHPRPYDHHHFVPRRDNDRGHEGETVLIVQSADPMHVLKALDHLHTRRLFRNPIYTLFCRNNPEVVRCFSEHPCLESIQTHVETRGSWKHLRNLRRRKFDAVVVFFTGDPSYWKVKYFAFLVGARLKLIFNENGDCFFFALRPWLALLAHRMWRRSRPGFRPRWTYQLRALALLSTKVILLPLRFAWLLLVWVRLRSAGSGI